MTLQASFIGNLLARQLRYDLGTGSVQDYNPGNGRGYLMSADGRIAVFVDLGDATPKYAVSFSPLLSSENQATRLTAAQSFVAGNTAIPASDAPSTSPGSLFYMAFDAAIVPIAQSLGAKVLEAGYTPADFSNTAMILETWLDTALANSAGADPNSGIRGLISGALGPEGAREFKLWTEGSDAMDDGSEMVLLPTPSTITDKTTPLNAKGGFDYLLLGNLMATTTGATVNFADVANQTYAIGGNTFNLRNFEGADLTDGADRFTGNGLDNTVFAGRGADTIDGGGAGTDRDWVMYANGTAGIRLTTATNGAMTVRDYGNANDTLTNVEAVGGTYFNDNFAGGTGAINQIFAGLKGADTIDGGGGTRDRVWHADDPSGVVVNLGTSVVNAKSVAAMVKVIAFGGADQAGLASLLVIREALDAVDLPAVTVRAGTALDGWGTVDTLSNVEGAVGSHFNDQLYGSNVSNFLSGGQGFDFLVGNGGNDLLIGGMGHDLLQGGLGRDWIVADELKWNGLTPSGSVDDSYYSQRAVRDPYMGGNIIAYSAVTESPAGVNADVIDGFALGEDVINLSGIDANVLRSGNQAFDDNFVSSFTKQAGQLRLVAFSGLVDDQNPTVSTVNSGYKLAGTALQGDVNGDGIADFEIKLVGVFISVDSNSDMQDLKDSLLF